MAKRLVFDRPINMQLSGNQDAAVPSDEVWSVCVYIGTTYDSAHPAPKKMLFSSGDTLYNFTIGGGCILSEQNHFSGIAFKIVEE